MEDTNTVTSLISFADNGSEILNNDSKCTLQTPLSSPHPPPRNRHNHHHKLSGHSQSAAYQVNILASKTKCGDSAITDLQHSSINPINVYYPNLRNKISFKDMHNKIGRLVLKDRNMWRYKKKSDAILVTD